MLMRKSQLKLFIRKFLSEQALDNQEYTGPGSKYNFDEKKLKPGDEGYGVVLTQSDKEYMNQFKVNNGDGKIITFESIEQNNVATKAKELVAAIGGAKDNNDAGVNSIYNNIHKPTHEAFGGSTGDIIEYPGGNSSATWKGTFENYLKNGEQYVLDPSQPEKYTPAANPSPGRINGGAAGAWSAWFLNACYILSDSDDDRGSLKIHAKRRAGRGCCYPNVEALANRKKIMSNPQSFIGEKLYVIFSAKELGADNNSAILEPPHLVKGDASIVKQTGATKTWQEISTEEENVTTKTHMNIYVGDGNYAGGNLGNTAKEGGSANEPATGFMKLVKVVKVEDEPLVAAN